MDRDVIQPSIPAAACPLRLSRIQPDVVVVAAGAENTADGPMRCMISKPEHAVVEREGPIEVGDLQMDVADVDAGIDRVYHGSIFSPKTRKGTRIPCSSGFRLQLTAAGSTSSLRRFIQLAASSDELCDCEHAGLRARRWPARGCRARRCRSRCVPRRRAL